MKTYKANNKEAADLLIDKLSVKDGVPFVMGFDYWINSQLSVAKYYGGMTYNNVRYQIDWDTGDLVRSDCYDLYVKFYKNDRPKLEEKDA